MASLRRVLSALNLTLLALFRGHGNFLETRNINRMTRVRHKSRLLQLRLTRRRPRQLTHALNLSVPRHKRRHTSNRVLRTLFETGPARLKVVRRRIPYGTRIIRRFLNITPGRRLQRQFSNLTGRIITATSNRRRSRAHSTIINTNKGLRMHEKVVQVKIRYVQTKGHH